MVYTYTYFAQTNLATSLSTYPLWIAHYGVETPSDNPIWNEWVGFQYSSTGDTPGVNGPCDLNVFTSGIFFSEIPPIPDPIPPEVIDTIYYTVKPGDTLSAIALKYNTTWEYLAQINNISNPNLIYPGQILTISTGSDTLPPSNLNIEYTVKPNDTLSDIANKYNTTWQYLAQINNLSNPNLIYPGQKLTIP